MGLQINFIKNKITNLTRGERFKKWRVVAALFIVAVWSSAVFAQRLPLRFYTAADGLANSVVTHVFRDSNGFLWFSTRDGIARFDGREFANYRLRDVATAQNIAAMVETRGGAYYVAAEDGLYRIRRRDAAAGRQETLIEEKNLESRHSLNAEKITDRSFRTLFEDHVGRIWGGSDDGLYSIEDAGEKISVTKIETGKGAANVLAIYEAADKSLWFGCETGAARRFSDGRVFYYPIKRASGYDETKTLSEDSRGRIYIGHSTGLFVIKPEMMDELRGAENFRTRPLVVSEANVENSGEISLPVESNRALKINFGETDSNKRAQNVTVREVFRAADGKIWVPAAGALFVFEENRIRHLRDGAGELPASVAKMTEDAAGNIWLGTNIGVIKLAREGFTTFGRGEDLQPPNVNAIYQTSNGRVAVVHGDWRVSFFDGERLVSAAALEMPTDARYIWNSSAAFLDSKNRWWALAENGLYGFAAPNRKAERIYRRADGLKGDSVFRAFEDSKGNLWFASRRDDETNGLTRLDAATGELRIFGAAENFPAGKSPVSFAEDERGNLWFGLFQGGLLRYRDGRFEQFTTDDGLPAGGIFALQFDRAGRLWVGSTKEGLSRIDDVDEVNLSFKKITTAEGLTSNYVQCLTIDAEGDIYVGTLRGVSRIDAETGALENFSTADGLAADYVFTAFRDKTGALWFGTPNGLSRFEPQPKIAARAAPRVFLSGLRIDGVRYSISEFGQSRIETSELSAAQNNLQINFLAVGENLRYQYRLENDSRDWSEPTFERTVNFANLAPGGYKFQVRAVNSAGQPSEQPASVIFTILPPFYRRWEFVAAIVLFAGFGVFLLDRYRSAKTRQVENALVKSIESETRFRTLAETASDAIITIDVESRIVFVNRAVEKVFGYSPAELIGEKLTVLMPDEMREQHENGLNRYVSTNRRKMSWSGVSLPGRHKTGREIPLEVSFGEFELEGKRFFTGVARDVSERLRAEADLRKSREERLKELERVRSRIAADLHDDIGANLTQIAVLSDFARNQFASKGKNSPLERIMSVSNDLVDAMSDIVWAINPQKDNLRDLVQRMRRFASDVFTARGVRFDFDAPFFEENVRLGANVRREVFAIFKEAVANAVKHSGSRTAKIELRIVAENLILQIADDGRGFDAKNPSAESQTGKAGGNGLPNMCRRASELGGSLKIGSSASGTIIRLEVPLANAPDATISTRTGGDTDGANV